MTDIGETLARAVAVGRGRGRADEAGEGARRRAAMSEHNLREIIGRLCKEVTATAGHGRDAGDGGRRGGLANDANDGDGGECARGGGPGDRQSGFWPRATK